MRIPRVVEIDRLRYWQGQLLRSLDFRDEVAFAAQLRWWHNRALHNAFGIAAGLEAELNPDATAVIVHAGVAYDCYGRELILPGDRTVDVPSISSGTGEMVLLAQYAGQGGECRTAPPVQGACLPAPCAPPSGSVEFLWKGADSVEKADGVPVARLAADGGAVLVGAAHVVRPAARPHVAVGATIPGATSWEKWTDISHQLFEGFQATVDTSAAGFTSVPCYFAWLEGPAADAKGRFFIPMFTHVGPAYDTKFVFRLVTTVTPALLAGIEGFGFPEFARANRLFISWLGIEALPGRAKSSEAG